MPKLPFVLLIACACSTSTSPADASGDGGVLPDASRVDVPAQPDAGPDVPLTPDAGVDAGNTDASMPDAGPSPLSSCEVMYFESVGEGCFCQGPVATYGNYVYRQSLGIEVYDATDPENPLRVGTVEERPSANGRIGVVGDFLVSTIEFEEFPLHLYSLENPAAPVEIARFGDGAAAGLALAPGEFVTIEDQGTPMRALVHYAFDESGAQETWRTPLGEALTSFGSGSVALHDGAAYVAEFIQQDPPLARIRRFDGVGAETASVERSGRGLNVTSLGGELYQLGGPSRLARLDAATLAVEASFGEPVFRETVTLRGRVLILNSSMTVLEASTLREVPVTTPDLVGFENLVAGAGDYLFGSNGNRLTPLSLRCE